MRLSKHKKLFNADPNKFANKISKSQEQNYMQRQSK